jgi:hypothetical protein
VISRLERKIVLGDLRATLISIDHAQQNTVTSLVPLRSFVVLPPPHFSQFILLLIRLSDSTILDIDFQIHTYRKYITQNTLRR